MTRENTNKTDWIYISDKEFLPVSLVSFKTGSNNRDFMEKHEREEEQDKSRGAIRRFPNYRFASNFSHPFSKADRCGWKATRQIIGRSWIFAHLSFLQLAWRYRPIKARAMSRKYVGMRVRMAYKCIGWLKISRFQNSPALLFCLYANGCALLVDTIGKSLKRSNVRRFKCIIAEYLHKICDYHTITCGFIYFS